MIDQKNQIFIPMLLWQGIANYKFISETPDLNPSKKGLKDRDSFSPGGDVAFSRNIHFYSCWSKILFQSPPCIPGCTRSRISKDILGNISPCTVVTCLPRGRLGFASSHGTNMPVGPLPKLYFCLTYIKTGTFTKEQTHHTFCITVGIVFWSIFFPIW